MAERRATGRVYKEVTLQQLRSFHEAARLKTFAAAAKSLGLAQPTVWAQVHGLERQFGVKLFETTRRGCQLTSAGQLLIALAASPLAGIHSLKERFEAARSGMETGLIVATTSRILIEDLPECVAEFSRRRPHVRVTLQDMTIEEVMDAVESGKADIGLTVPWPGPPREWLVFEPAYEYEVLLLTPKNHPLARRRQVKPTDLRGFPILNAPHTFKDHLVATTLDRLGLYLTQPRQVEVGYVPAIRRYVELGFGIGLIAGRLGSVPSRRLHQRSMSHHFGRITIYLVSRRKHLPEESAAVFADVVRTRLNRPAS
jgi:DNA-binding transcriptional LysR family regulator